MPAMPCGCIKKLGFETLETYEALQDFGDGYVNDYFEWLKERTDVQERDSGLSSNSWIGGESCLLEKMDVGPTWFLFTSDHGEMLGDHNLFRKTYAYEGSAGIPLIITPPEVPGQRRAAAPVSQVDIMPTLLEAAGLEIPGRVKGRSMLPLLP